LILGFSQRSSSRNTREFEIVFMIKLLNSKVLNPCEISINTNKIKTKNLPQNLIKSWDVTDYHP
jgi:hypothetical protein